MADESERAYEGRIEARREAVAAPELPYRPRNPVRFNPEIGLIGCGGIAESHLAAYRKAGYRVTALCDTHEIRAREKQQRYFPDAKVCTDYKALLACDNIEVVDAATHPAERAAIVAAALKSGKHVLSQKPFAVDLDAGARLCELAEQHGVKLAVNQNGRWAPHFSYLRHAVDAGVIGGVRGAHFAVRWDHNWIAGTPFDAIKHVILYDFAIHWFDILHCFLRTQTAKRVFASVRRSATQTALPPLQAQILAEFDGAQASLSFDGDTRHGQRDETWLLGETGTLVSSGPNLTSQQVELHTQAGVARPELLGTWFEDGFHGTLAELLCAIEENREPYNNARDNLKTLELCFAAVASADRGEPVAVGSVRKI
jgi:predicted dehydrogenase